MLRKLLGEMSGGQTVTDDEFDSELQSQHSLNTWARIYLHGCIAFVVLYAMGYVVSRLVPLFNFTGNPALAVLVSVLVIIFVPPLVGSFVLYGLLPWLGKHEAWRGVNAWDDRLISEVSRAKQRARVVIVNWPSRETRTIGVLTSTFTVPGSEEVRGAVYIPTAPYTKLGYIHVMSLSDIEFTDLTLKQWQLFHLTFGAAVPDDLRSTEAVGEIT